jgi:hypothetical protein
MADLPSLLSPFPSSKALSSDILRTPDQKRLTQSRPPSPSNGSNGSIDYVPGEPGTDLTRASVYDFLTSELDTPILDQLYNHLWSVARKSGKSIDPLNKQRVKAREIVATEDASLHLVWHRDKIYIKPMPLCLLNYDFWTTFLPRPIAYTTSLDRTVSASVLHPPEQMFDRKIALGFMRSYALLVRHHVDFRLACESHLLPARLDWTKWSEFIVHFRSIEDEDIARRYHYGQLRLSRLNWAVRWFRPSSAETKWFYAVPLWSIGMYVERTIAPLLFGFASLSLVLSSMQVLLSVPDDGLGPFHVDAASLSVMNKAFWVFSIIILLLTGLTWVLLFVIPVGAFFWQFTWGFQHRDKSVKAGSMPVNQRVTAKV